MPPIDIQLNDYFEAFVRARAGTGPYRDASDVILAALRLLEQQEQGLRELIEEGIGDGSFSPAEEVFARLEAKYRESQTGHQLDW